MNKTAIRLKSVFPSKRNQDSKNCIPYGKHWIGEDEVQEVVETLRTGYLTSGPKVERFENELRQYLGAKYTVTTGSCSAALHLSILAFGIKPGDEVITTPFTYVATVNAILHAGAIPIFVDIDPKTYSIDPLKIEERITPRTKAILIVHYAGQPCAIREIGKIARNYQLAVIEDSSHAIGATYQNRKVGCDSDSACFSFHPVKNMTTAEGGLIATKHEHIARLCKAFRLHGFLEDYREREQAEFFEYPQMQYLGFKYNMTDLQAAIGLWQLKKLDQFNKRRSEIAQMYSAGLKDREELILPYVSPEGVHVWHLYVVRLRLERLQVSRAEFMKRLADRNITTSVHYLPVHLHTYYRNRFQTKEGDFPIAEDVYRSIVTIPLFPKMNGDEVQYVIDTIQKVLDETKR